VPHGKDLTGFRQQGRGSAVVAELSLGRPRPALTQTWMAEVGTWPAGEAAWRCDGLQSCGDARGHGFCRQRRRILLGWVTGLKIEDLEGLKQSWGLRTVSSEWPQGRRDCPTVHLVEGPRSDGVCGARLRLMDSPATCDYALRNREPIDTLTCAWRKQRHCRCRGSTP